MFLSSIRQKKSRHMKKTASYCIYIDEIFFYLCTFSSGRKLRLSVKRAIICVNRFLRKTLKTGLLNVNDFVKTTYIFLSRIHKNMMHTFPCTRNIPVLLHEWL